MNIRRTTVATKRVRLAEFDEQSELVIPEDLSALSDDDLASLEEQAVEAARALAEQERTPEVIEALTALRDGVTAIRSESATRAEAAAAAEQEVDSLLADIVGEAGGADEGGETAEEAVAEEDEEEVEDREEALVASGRREVRISPALLRNRNPQRQEEETPAERTIRDFARAAADVSGFANGQALDYNGMAEAVIARLKGYNHRVYETAARSGQKVRDQFGTIIIDKPVDERLVVSKSDSEERIAQVFDLAADMSRLPEGTLTAAGWCAPSETLYDLFDQGESTEGMLSAPEVTVRRGGFRWPVAADFSTVFGNLGWDYTEDEAEAGNWDGAGGGAKPCFYVDCPDFDEARLDAVGLCIKAGLLQRVGYPEVIADSVRKALIAHAHRVNAKKINAFVAASTPVSMAAGQKGAVAPILTAIELQVQHYRYSHLLNQNTTLEAVFPFWVHGVVRSDLSRRLGLAEFDVSDQRINAWFAQRGIRPQFVYDWQSLATTGASGFNAWPTTVSFLLYKAGTFVVGGADVLTVDTVYDSTLLGQNDYTALWTEEGMLVAKRGIDSRVVTVPFEADGATHVGIDITRTGA